MKHTIISRAAAGALATGMAAAVVLAVPTAAFARPLSATTTSVTTAASSPSSATTAPTSSPLCTPAVFSQAQQRVEAALSARVTQLNALASAAGSTANHLTTGDRQTLSNDINTVDLPGIQALQPQAQQATTCPQLRAVAHSMVFTYRVYMVMTPQTHLTIVADDESYVEGVFVNLESTIAQAIQNAQAHGKNTTAAQAAFTDLKNQVASAQSETAGQSATVLAQTPAGAPGNWQVFLGARTNLVNAHSDLHTAYTDAQQIRADLQ